MKLRNYCLAAGCFAMQQSTAQVYYANSYYFEPAVLWEAGISMGAVNCLTDLGGHKGTGKKFIKDINWNNTQYCAGLFVHASWQEAFSIRLQGTRARISASDDNLKDITGPAQYRYQRHLSVSTTITELAALVECHPLLLSASYDDGSLLFSPYVIAGIGGCHYNPQAKHNNLWVDLRSLHTEGQGFVAGSAAYKSLTWCLPVGGGIKYDPGGLLLLRIEIVYRVMGTDYLDDVSLNYIDPALFFTYLPATRAAIAAQLADRRGAGNPGDQRGNPHNRDAYFDCSLKIALALNRRQR
jgi:hypothetical protein